MSTIRRAFAAVGVRFAEGIEQGIEQGRFLLEQDGAT